MQEQRDVPYGHASMLLIDEGSEATEPCNKNDTYFFGLVQPKFIFGLVQPVMIDSSFTTRNLEN